MAFTLGIILGLLTQTLHADPRTPSTPTFRIQPDYTFSKGSHNYRTLLVDEDSHSLLIGGSNWIFRTWLFNVNDTENASFFAKREIGPTDEAARLCRYRSHDPTLYCQNHIKVIINLPDGSLYVCGTNANTPMVTKLDGKSLEILEGEMTGAGICGDENGTAVYVEKGNPGGIPSIYTGSKVSDFNKIIYRPPLIDSNGQVAFPFMRTKNTDSKWLNEADFVGSFEQGEYVYFFFRETAVEYINCGNEKAVYSRVARICKKDVGGKHVLKQNWATYLKARLNCSIAGEFPFYFNHIQDVYKVEESGESIFYATFTTGANGFVGSAVCAFSLSDIDRVFDHGSFKEQLKSTSAWLPVLPSLVPSPRPGQCVEDTLSISDSALHFINSHPLMDDSVPALGGGPIHYLRDTILTQLVVDTVSADESNYRVIFAGSTDGSVLKILHSPRDSDVSFGLSVYTLPTTQPIRDMQLLKNDFVYIAQDQTVSQMNPSQCSKYSTCSSCTMDPYCAWNNMKQQCRRARDEYRFSIGWVMSQPDRQGEVEQCEFRTRKQTHLLYPGDSVHLPCLSRGERTRWTKNNRTVDLFSGTHLLTVDGGLVIVNITAKDQGNYDCYTGRLVAHSHQLFVDNVNCQRPSNVQGFLAVYKEWCREFQEYKTTMLKWKQWYEENTQCSSKTGDSRKRLPDNLDLDDKKTNRISDIRH